MSPEAFHEAAQSFLQGPNQDTGRPDYIRRFEMATSNHRADIQEANEETLLPLIDAVETLLMSDAGNWHEPLYRGVVAISNIGSHSPLQEVKSRAMSALFHYMDAQVTSGNIRRIDANHIGRIAKTAKGDDLAITALTEFQSRLNTWAVDANSQDQLLRAAVDVTEDAVENGYWEVAQQGMDILFSELKRPQRFSFYDEKPSILQYALRITAYQFGRVKPESLIEPIQDEKFNALIDYLNREGRIAQLLKATNVQYLDFIAKRPMPRDEYDTLLKRIQSVSVLGTMAHDAVDKIHAMTILDPLIGTSGKYFFKDWSSHVGVHGVQEIITIARSSEDVRVRQSAQNILREAQMILWQHSDVAIAVGEAINRGLNVLSMGHA